MIFIISILAAAITILALTLSKDSISSSVSPKTTKPKEQKPEEPRKDQEKPKDQKHKEESRRDKEKPKVGETESGNLVSKVLGTANYPKPAGNQLYGKPRDGGKRKHAGVDVALPEGKPIYAPFDGKVLRAPGYGKYPSNGAGNYVVLQRKGSSEVLVSMHHFRNLVRDGEEVKSGQQIAEVGSSGFGKQRYSGWGPHAHIEFRKTDRGETFDPLKVTISSETVSANEEPQKPQLETIKPKATNTLSSFEKETKIINLMKQELNMSLEASCGLIGNLICESGLSETAHNKSNPYGKYGAQGIAQWRGERVTNYIKKFGAGKDIITDANFDHQIHFIVYELRTFFQASILNKLNGVTVEQASDLFLTVYEAPGNADSHKVRRRNVSLEVYNRHKVQTNETSIETTRKSEAIARNSIIVSTQSVTTRAEHIITERLA